MKLVSFSVSDFRSITKAKKVPLASYSLLVGANNEGKSNILLALALGMEALVQFKNSVRRDSLGRVIRVSPSLMGSRIGYNWRTDFPISKQTTTTKDKATKVTLEFFLDEKETAEFKEEIGSNLNGTLPIVLEFQSNDFKVTIAKQGKGGNALTKKAARIAEFVSKRIKFEYIPAIRTSERAAQVVSELVSEELSILERDPKYQKVIEAIEELQRPILEALSATIKETVSGFLPSVVSVELTSKRTERYRALRHSVAIEIDDGTKTSLANKGDGIKSLVALALMRHAAQRSSSAETTIFAIEEPEAHLHPKAIHELREVISGLPSSNQIVITSHSPLFVNPAVLSSTIVVKESSAIPARNIAEVRDVLGVRLADNLQSARLVAIVEGRNDIRSLPAIVAHRFPELQAAIRDGEIVFDELGGAGSLSYKIRLYRSSATLVQCFLDNDSSGVSAVQKALEDGLITNADYNLISVKSLGESELEDVFNPRAYRDDFINEFAVDPTQKMPETRSLKWSDAMGVRFKSAGKVWSKPIEMQVKNWVADFVARNPESALIEAHLGPIDAFCKTLLQKLSGLQ